MKIKKTISRLWLKANILFFKPKTLKDLNDSEKRAYGFVKTLNPSCFDKKEANIINKIKNDIDINLLTSRGILGIVGIVLSPFLFGALAFGAFYSLVLLYSATQIILFVPLQIFLFFTSLVFMFVPATLVDKVHALNTDQKNKIIEKINNLPASSDLKLAIVNMLNLPIQKEFWGKLFSDLEGLGDDIKGDISMDEDGVVYMDLPPQSCNIKIYENKDKIKSQIDKI